MTDKWRPEGWKPHYTEEEINRESNPDLRCGLAVYNLTFEAGADAMLEALRARGEHYDMVISGGTKVFIPDDK